MPLPEQLFISVTAIGQAKSQHTRRYMARQFSLRKSESVPEFPWCPFYLNKVNMLSWTLSDLRLKQIFQVGLTIGELTTIN